MTEQHFETTSPTAGNNLAYTSLELFCIFDVVLLLWFFNISGPKQLSSINPTQKGVMYISLVQSYRQIRMGLHLDKRVEPENKGSVGTKSALQSIVRQLSLKFRLLPKYDTHPKMMLKMPKTL